MTPQLQVPNHNEGTRRHSSSGHTRSRHSRPASFMQPDLAVDTGPELKTDQEEVLKFIRAHKSYKHPTEDEEIVAEHPKFDDITRYMAFLKNAKTSSGLWRLSVFSVRLQILMNLYDSSLLFRTGVSTRQNDNEIIMFDNERELFNPRAYMVARNILSNAFDPVDAEAQPGRLPRGKENPSDLDIDGKTAEICCAFVDYVTACVARFALRGMPSKFWHTRALSGLAKVSAKIKFLFSDLEKLALQSLEEGQDALAKDEGFNALGGGAKGPVLDIVGPDGQPFQSRLKREDATDSAAIHRLLNQKQQGDIYYPDMGLTYSWTIGALQAVFLWFQKSSRSGYAVDAFDICGIVYKAGIDGLLTLVYQERDGELGGSSNREVVKLSYSGFKMLSQVATLLKNDIRHRSPPSTARVSANATVPSAPKTPSSDTGATLSMDFEEEKKGGRGSHDDPFIRQSFTSNCPSQLNNLIWAMDNVMRTSVTHSIDYSSLPGTRFTAFASLRTNTYESVVRHKLVTSDARSLSQSLMARNRLHTYDQPETTDTKVWEGLDVVDQQRKVHDAEQRLRQLKHRIQTWEIEETAIVVPKQRFVILIMVGCSILVIGGLMAGIFLGERLTGVDPFNITVFAWVLAGFIILVAKSLLVSEWPWRDFLKGRVPCRSTTELVAVTEVSAQEILEYLLSNEHYTILIVKGPYHRSFTRQSDAGGGGFSIDVRIELRTLIASGIIVVKVTGRQGHGLVCMDLRRGAQGKRHISHSDEIEGNEHVLACYDLNEAFDEDQDVLLLDVSAATWTRILGIYHRPKRLFR
ncbi:hypothetical protein QBC40DRAFT_323004 [Triangularia verruculosa]|uniref:Uncharacterized protein n=1 Tax=Triangularia verruculosa TaxID=2587418 RepID=A0AAN6XJI6_9PEZI|nr:hypothetical protein QBC40DRAFT_323004 [Triangularia verruculosa]